MALIYNWTLRDILSTLKAVTEIKDGQSIKANLTIKFDVPQQKGKFWKLFDG